MHEEYNHGILEYVQGQVENKADLSQPRRYKVFLLNDDYTPMDFVVMVLQRFFYMQKEQATLIMLQVHRQGKGLCGVFTHEIAETKVAIVNAYARRNGHPLLASMEPE